MTVGGKHHSQMLHESEEESASALETYQEFIIFLHLNIYFQKSGDWLCVVA